MDEFGLIRTYFAPLAAGFSGSLNLADDAAAIDIPPGKQLVITKDAIVKGVHFIGDEDPALIAKKLLRVNLSDLVAKGATPLCYFLALMLPSDTPESWIARFAEGFHEDQKTYAIHLAGGDTTKTQGGLSLSLTALGLVERGKMLRRSGANIGDDIYVSGTIGDGALGLSLMIKDPHPNPLPKREREFLEDRYRLPQPRLTLGRQLVGIATACMDISDGLVQDLGHLCAAAKLGARMVRERVPLSGAVQHLLKESPVLWERILTGGDDYELLFTAPMSARTALAALPVTRIGEMVTGSGVSVVTETGESVALSQTGWRHF